MTYFLTTLFDVVQTPAILFSTKGETSVKVTFLVVLKLTLLYLGKYSTDLFLQKGFLFIVKEKKNIKDKLTNVKENHFSFVISFD